MAIIQDGFPPHPSVCTICGLLWDANPGRGGRHSENSLWNDALKHWETCPGEPGDKQGGDR